MKDEGVSHSVQQTRQNPSHLRQKLNWHANEKKQRIKREDNERRRCMQLSCNSILLLSPDLDIFFTFIVHNIALVVAFVREQSSLTQVPCGSTSCQRNWDEILLVTPFTDLSLSFSWYFLSDQKMKTHRLKDRESRWLEEYSVCQENRENLPIIP